MPRIVKKNSQNRCPTIYILPDNSKQTKKSTAPIPATILQQHRSENAFIYFLIFKSK